MGGDLRIVAVQTTESVETARRRLDLSPIATDALGRAMTASLLLARLLEKHVRHQKVTLRFEGSGPLGLLIAEGSLDGFTRGYVSEPQLAGSDHLSVGEALGSSGSLTVIRGTPPNGSPYTAQIELVSGEIAKDVAHYLSVSEQIASAVMLGVLNRPHGVAAAGGLIIQAYPHAEASRIAEVERRILESPPLSLMIDQGGIETALETLFEGLDFKRLDPGFDVPVAFRCSCTRERALTSLSLLNEEELEEMMDQEGGAVVTCQYCRDRYEFSPEEMRWLTAPPDA